MQLAVRIFVNQRVSRRVSMWRIANMRAIGICVGVYTLWVAVYTNKKKLLHRLYTFIFRLYRSSKQLKTHRKRIISCFQQSKKCFSIFLTFFFGGVYCYPLVCVAVYTPHFPIFLKRFRCHHTPASKTTVPGFKPVSACLNRSRSGMNAVGII